MKNYHVGVEHCVDINNGNHTFSEKIHLACKRPA